MTIKIQQPPFNEQVFNGSLSTGVDGENLRGSIYLRIGPLFWTRILNSICIL